MLIKKCLKLDYAKYNFWKIGITVLGHFLPQKALSRVVGGGFILNLFHTLLK